MTVHDMDTVHNQADKPQHQGFSIAMRGSWENAESLERSSWRTARGGPCFLKYNTAKVAPIALTPFVRGGLIKTSCDHMQINIL